MPSPNRFRASTLLLGSTCFFAVCAAAQTMADQRPDFSGIWQLNDKESDSLAVIKQRWRAEKQHEQPPSSRPASTSSSGTPALSAHNNYGSHRGGGGMGGGRGMGGHGMGGRRGDRDAQAQSSDSSAPPKDPTPPLFAEDALLNVQQTRQGMRVDLNNNDRLDTKFDGVERQSLNSTARVKSSLTASGLQVSMEFDDGTRLDQTWVRSPDGRHLAVTESWTTDGVKSPIAFKRYYDRLDL